MSLEEIAQSSHLSISGNTSRIWMAAWHHKGDLLASCGEDKTVRIWNVRQDAESCKFSLECVTTLDESHTRAIRCVNFSNSGQLLASASFDATIVIYQKDENGEFTEVNKLEGHESEVKWCAFSMSDEFLATCSRDKTVWVWQMDEDDDFNVSSILQPHTQDVKFVAWHPSEELLVSCSYDSSVRFFTYDGDDWVTKQKFDKAHAGTVWCAAFDARGHRMVTVGEDAVIQVYTRRNPTELSAVDDEWKIASRLQIDDTIWPIYSVSWNRFNDFILTAGGDGKIRLFKVSGTIENSLIEPMGVMARLGDEINSIAWCPVENRQNLAVTTADDGTIRLWHLRI
ncbi:unnamed protein product [Caenorhabditis bovis]|uniref:Probable cytosolic iron-sulfur protein assembly protein CIAO1 homolog n=1 Tax=Caenorhabditis bovis TaxID=2654633 RepID=A0A8S1EZ27_9PELO|nr:unnamed protein product [Caenorhabditis bovis]